MEYHMILEGKKLEYNGQIYRIDQTTTSGLLVSEFKNNIEITVPCISRTSVVTVYKPDSMFGGEFPTPARINWSACGSQGIDEAHFFIEALNLAKTYAEELNKVYGVKAAK